MALEDMFRAYDVRGTEDELTQDVMERIGRAFAADCGDDAGTVMLGHDVRRTSPALAAAFIQGATESGLDVLDAGLVPYGAVLWASRERGIPSAYITASHLTPEWNGIKFGDPAGVGYRAGENEAVKERFFDEDYVSGDGEAQSLAILPQYQEALLERVDIAELSVLMDCGNGATTVIAPEIAYAAGVDVAAMHDTPDGSFPNRHSDVDPDALSALSERMEAEDHDLGVAYDGDGDRVAAVDGTGTVLSAEQLAYVLLDHLLPDEDGPIVANVECSRLLEDVAAEHGREVIRVRVGHSYLVEAVQEHDACLGVETSRHMTVPRVLPVDDGIAASLAAMEAVSHLEEPLSAVVEDIPTYVRDRIPFEVADDRKFAVIESLQEQLSDAYEDTNTTDGVRVNLEQGWVLIRASNTSPKIRLTVEAETQDDFDDLQQEFSAVVEDAL